MERKKFISLLLLAGGIGSRMGDPLPKQFKPLRGKPLALYSFDLFDQMAEISEIVVVCNPSYHSLFTSISKPVHFALPGKRRQDSVYSGLLAASKEAQLICIHDSARPFPDKNHIIELFNEALSSGAAALATPAINTIKRADELQRVLKTLPREELWEIQTPQAIDKDLLHKAYKYAQKNKIEATDDLSLIEAIDAPAVLVKSSPRNLKVTTHFDWAVAETILCAASN